MGAQVTLVGDRRAYGSVPKEIHQLIVDEYERTGVVPTSTTIADLTGIHQGTVARVMKELCEAGDLAQPYGPRTPYVPLRRPDGTRVTPALLTDDETPTIHTPPSTTEELLEEALRRLREGK